MRTGYKPIPGGRDIINHTLSKYRPLLLNSSSQSEYLIKFTTENEFLFNQFVIYCTSESICCYYISLNKFLLSIKFSLFHVSDFCAYVCVGFNIIKNMLEDISWFVSCISICVIRFDCYQEYLVQICTPMQMSISFIKYACIHTDWVETLLMWTSFKCVHVHAYAYMWDS